MHNEHLRIMIVDDSPEDTRIIRRLLTRANDGVQVMSASTTARCLERLQTEGADLILLDYQMPGEDGIEFLQRLAGLLKLPPVILLTGQGSERLAVEAIRSGAFDYVPKDALTEDLLGATIAEALERFRRDEELSEVDDQIMVALAAAAEGNDPTTAGHLQRIARCALLLGKELDLSAAELDILRYGALLHDIGKLAVPATILGKPGPLTFEEFEAMQQHVIVGERLCTCLWCSSKIAPIIRHHHERWDGNGYIEGLAGKEIPLLARVVSVADAFDAMASDRPYRKALEPDHVISELQKGAGRQWDPQITEIFVSLVEREALDPIVRTHAHERRAA